MNRVNSVYNSIRIDETFLRAAILKAEQTPPKKNHKPFAVAVIAASLALLILAAVVFRPAEIPSVNTTSPEISFDSVTRLHAVLPTGAENDGLILHDGIAMWIEGAYYNGSRMIVAVRGEAGSPYPDVITCESSAISADVNDRTAEVVSERLEMTKRHGLYEGILELRTDVDESSVMLSMVCDTVKAHSGKSVRTVNERFEMANIISRVYAKSGEKALTGDDIFVSGVATFPEGAIGDAAVGLTATVYVPDRLYLGDDGMDVRIKAYNADGSEIPYIGAAHQTDSTGELKHMSFGYPTSRDITLRLIDKNHTNSIIAEHSVRLNEPYESIMMDD